MSKGVHIVALTAAALALVPASAAAAEPCPRDDDAAIAVYLPELVRPGDDVRVELEGEAAVADAYANVVVTVDGVATPVALEGFGTAFVTVRAPARPGSFAVTVTWDQSPNANGDEAGGVACSGGTTVETLAARWSGAVGDVAAPRVQGNWTMLSTPLQRGPRERFPWRLRPTCGIGACDLLLDTGPGTQGERLRLEDGVYRRTHRRRIRLQCNLLSRVGGRTQARLVSGSAVAVAELTFSVAAWRRVDGQRVATRLVGRDTLTATRIRGPIRPCRYPQRRWSISAVPR